MAKMENSEKLLRNTEGMHYFRIIEPTKTVSIAEIILEKFARK